MNHLIIYTHPNINSFSCAIVDAVKEFSMQQKYKTEIRDLYSIGFDPVLKLTDLSDIHEGKVPEDIKREQSYIEWADIVTFIYPIWWTGMPAILKGYIDRVFSYGIAYKQGKNGSEGLLKDKKVFIFSPMGTSNETYNKNGMTDAMKRVSEVGIFNFCGMKVEQHAFFGDVPNVEEKVRKQYLQVVSEIFLRSLKSDKDSKDSSQGNQGKDCQSNKENNDKNNGSNNSNSNNKNKDDTDNKGQKNNQGDSSNNNKDKGGNDKESSNEKNTDKKENKNNKSGNSSTLNNNS